MWEDPIIEETRRIRREIESECDNNFDRLLENAVEIQKKYSNRLVSRLFESRKETEPAPVVRVKKGGATVPDLTTDISHRT